MHHDDPLPLQAYRAAIDLDRPFVPAGRPVPPDQLAGLAETALELLHPQGAAGPAQARQALRAALTRRHPVPMRPEVLMLLDSLLGGERALRPTIAPETLPLVAEDHPGSGYPAAKQVSTWRGDITTLRADAIVNAANDTLLGCFRPHHPCVDNAIHAAAGPRLRADCHTIMTEQRFPEPTGTAKITRGYHLPARFVLHTVGPIVRGPLRPQHEQALAASYRACLDLAAQVPQIRTIAFCAISTGVFGFPPAPAARIALTTVADWLDEHPARFDRVILVSFDAAAEALHHELLATWTR
ncbi:MAG TPA: macro domain-containing protein [Kutzneria sp.]|nr:macro domain-containing protein [Kutzneria sp.]